MEGLFIAARMPLQILAIWVCFWKEWREASNIKGRYSISIQCRIFALHLRNGKFEKKALKSLWNVFDADDVHRYLKDKLDSSKWAKCNICQTIAEFWNFAGKRGRLISCDARVSAALGLISYTKTTFQLSGKMKINLETMKIKMTCTPWPALLTFRKSIIMSADDSSQNVKAVTFQKKEDAKMHCIKLASRNMTRRE